MSDLDRLAAAIDDADATVALTGAGISAASGVPTFRGEDGIWERFEQGQFAYGRFQRDPAGFWADRLDLHDEMYGDEPPAPNDAHLALAELGAEGALDAIVTQNVDGLHERATEAAASWNDVAGRDVESGDPASGADEVDDDEIAEVLELHGNARRVVCTDCGRRIDAGPVTERVRGGERPPLCDCGGVLKPDVVLFGEQLPGAALQRARSLARESDVFLAIGSSLVVEPAASLPDLAASSGGTLGVVNLEETPVDGRADAVLRADVTEVLPELVDLVDA